MSEVPDPRGIPVDTAWQAESAIRARAGENSMQIGQHNKLEKTSGNAESAKINLISDCNEGNEGTGTYVCTGEGGGKQHL